MEKYCSGSPLFERQTMSMPRGACGTIAAPGKIDVRPVREVLKRSEAHGVASKLRKLAAWCPEKTRTRAYRRCRASTSVPR